MEAQLFIYLSSMLYLRFGHKMITVGDKMYVIGGSTEDNVVDSIEQYDPIQG